MKWEAITNQITIAEGDKTLQELNDLTGERSDRFLRKAKIMGFVERYYNKKENKYYYTLIAHNYKRFLDKEDNKVQTRMLEFLMFVANYRD